MVLSCRAAIGAGGERKSAGGERSLAMAANSRQQAEEVELVTRPIYPRTALISLRVQGAISG